MNRPNPVLIKRRKAGIYITLDAFIPFEELKNFVKERIIDARAFFGDAKTNIVFSGRNLSDEEESALLNIIRTESALDIPLMVDSEAEEEYAGSSPPPFAQPSPEPPSASEQTKPKSRYYPRKETVPAENAVDFYYGTLRSGKKQVYKGSVVVTGDVNGEIVAEGNVIVLGTLRGMVHAGFPNHTESFIYALKMWPVEVVRIAHKITNIPENLRSDKPAYAYLDNDQIHINPQLKRNP